MKRAIWLAVFGFTPMFGFAQFDPPKLSPASAHYHIYRMFENKPPYELAAAEAASKAMPENDQEPDANMKAQIKKLTKMWNALTTEGKFTYCMLGGEDYSQNCDGMPAVLNEEKKIFDHPVVAYFGEEEWSARQKRFLHSHRSLAIRLIRSTMKSQKRVGANLKKAIDELDAVELIPDMLALYRRDHKDKDILSSCCDLMQDAEYRPFLRSWQARSLFGDDESRQSFVKFSPAFERFILAQSMDFSASRKR